MHCPHCSADPDNDTLEDCIQKLNNCTNCLSDLKLKGNWTGDGQKIAERLVEIYGIDHIKFTVEKVEFEEI